MIKRLSIIKDVHPFKTGTSFNFQPGLNLVCGDQGTGKSTLLEMIMMNDREYAQHVQIEQDGSRYQAFAYHNSEYHNPRTFQGGMAIGETRYNATLEMFYTRCMEKVGSRNYANSHIFKMLLGEAYMSIKNASINVIDKKLVDLDVITKSALQSHGQALFPFLEEALKVRQGLIFLDEPEAGLSSRSQLKLASMLVNAAQTSQIFVATHSEILIKYNQVLSLDEPIPTWVKGKDFIQKQYGN